MHAVQNKCLFYIIQNLCWYLLLLFINTTETHVICIHCISIFVYHMSLFKNFFGSNYHWFWKTLLFKDSYIMFCSKRYALVLFYFSDCVISDTRTIFYYCYFIVLNQRTFLRSIILSEILSSLRHNFNITFVWMKLWQASKK